MASECMMRLDAAAVDVMRRKIFFAILFAFAMRASAAYAHGVVGDYVFLEPLVAEDPTPANELDIVQPGWARTSEGRNFSIGTSIEKILYVDQNELPRFSIGGGTNWSYQSPNEGPNDNGFDDLEVFGKYAF